MDQVAFFSVGTPHICWSYIHNLYMMCLPASKAHTEPYDYKNFPLPSKLVVEEILVLVLEYYLFYWFSICYTRAVTRRDIWGIWDYSYYNLYFYIKLCLFWLILSLLLLLLLSYYYEMSNLHPNTLSGKNSLKCFGHLTKKRKKKKKTMMVLLCSPENPRYSY